MEKAGPIVTSSDPDLERILHALLGHDAKPFVVCNSINGARIGWWDTREHAENAARFATHGTNVAHVVYQAVTVIEPVKGITHEITRSGVTRQASAG